MKKIVLLFCLLSLVNLGFAENLVLKNQTQYPCKGSKIAVQWANSARDVNEGNTAVITGAKLNSTSLQTLKKSGTVTLSVPTGAEYFRVLVWSQGKEEPDLLTNWVEIIPNKTYTLQSDHLVPALLMLGMGC